MNSLIATNLLRLCNASIILTFVSGEHRPITLGSSSIASTSVSGILSNSAALITAYRGRHFMSTSRTIPTSCAIASAVLG